MKKLLSYLFGKKIVKNNLIKKDYHNYFVDYLPDGRVLAYYAVNYKHKCVLMISVTGYFGIKYGITCVENIKGTEITKEEFLKHYDNAINHLQTVERPI